MADSQCRQLSRPFPGGAEGCCPSVGIGERPGRICRFEKAIAEPAKKLSPADTQHCQVNFAVAVYVDRVSPDDVGEVGGGRGEPSELEGATGRAVVAIDRRGVATAGDVEVRFAVAVAVQNRDSAADGEPGAVSGVDLVYAGGRRLIDEVRCTQSDRRRG